MSQQPEDALISHLQQGSLDPVGWQNFVLELERNCGGAKASLHGVSDTLPNPILAVAGSFAPDFSASYLAHYHRLNPFMALSASLPQAKVRISPTDLPDAALRQTEFYQDWLRPQEDLALAVAVRTRPHENRSVVLSLNLRRRDGFEAALRAQQVLARLEPHLTHAFRVAEIVSALKIGGTVVPQLRQGKEETSARTGGLVMLDDRLTLVWAEAGALQQEGSVFQLDPFQRVRFRDGAVQNWVRTMVRATGRGERAAFPLIPSPPLSLSMKSGWQIGLVGAADGLALSSPFFGRHGLARPRTLFLLSLPRTSSIPTAALQARFGLTNAEAQIAFAIAQGLTTAEMAERRQVSLHTVRNQVRTVLTKMEARHRIDVARILLRFAEGGVP
jgi:DNA-binding CsgD family transcriptional regulator